MAGTLVRGKVTREILNDVFGANLLATVQAAFRTQEEASTTTRRQRARKRNSMRAPDATEGAAEGKAGEGEEGEEGDEEEEDDLANQLAGSDTVPGKLQVMVWC